MKNSASFIVVVELDESNWIEVIEIDYSDKCEIPSLLTQVVLDRHIHTTNIKFLSIAKLD